MCRGELVNRIGVRAGVRDGFALWAGPRRVADRYATDELRDFWLERPSVTVTQYAAQRAACMRVARTDAVRAWLLPGQAADILLGQGKAQSSSSEGRWRVAVQDLPVGAVRRGGAVGVQDDLPVPAVDTNVVVKLAQ